MYREDEGERGANAPRRQSGRGLAYWSGGGESRIVYVTPGYRMIALDAKTGHRVPGFGQNGVVDLKTDFDQTIDLVKSDVGLAATPIIANDVIVVGAAHGVGTAPPRMENVKGYVRGFDARTGQASLDIPHDPAQRRVRLRDMAQRLGSSRGKRRRVDADRRRRRAQHRVSASRAANRVISTVATGRAPAFSASRSSPSISAPGGASGTTSWCITASGTATLARRAILADIVVGGRAIKAVAQPTKQGFLFVFDRATGEPCGRSRNARCLRATSLASGTRRHNRSQRSPRLSSGRACRKTT